MNNNIAIIPMKMFGTMTYICTLAANGSSFALMYILILIIIDGLDKLNFTIDFYVSKIPFRDLSTEFLLEII